MKSMKEKGLEGMKKKEAESFFPNDSHMKVMKRAGEVKQFKYPDTEEMIHKAQDENVQKLSKALPKPEFRH